KHWPEVYRYSRTHQWEGTTSRWTDWRDVVHRYRQSTSEAFWTEFSVDGRNMSFTAIIAALQKQCQVDKQDIVATACEEYGEEFDVKFSY
ncbi:hypothetical protein CY34DRAFT_99330, partial [Suillus luteus UH-Slu-Lm8-n1]